MGDLYVGQNMPVTWLGERDSPGGLWLGWPIALEPAVPPAVGDRCDVEGYVYTHRGSFIFIDFTAEEPWIYLDACGSLSLVYDHIHGGVASTAWAAIGPDEYRRRFRPEQLEIYNVEAHGWIPGGDQPMKACSVLWPTIALLHCRGGSRGIGRLAASTQEARTTYISMRLVKNAPLCSAT